MHLRELTNLPTPDFAFDPNVPGACVTGVGPYREGNLPAELRAGVRPVHRFQLQATVALLRISLSWGCAAS